MTNFAHGRKAEEVGVEYLQGLGYQIVTQNWRTRVCEIDIVAKKDNVIYFVEVKYRKSVNQGSGLDYITSKKLEQMEFAARLWVQEAGWSGDYRLSALEVSGQNYAISAFLPQI